MALVATSSGRPTLIRPVVCAAAMRAPVGVCAYCVPVVLVTRHGPAVGENGSFTGPTSCHWTSAGGDVSGAGSAVRGQPDDGGAGEGGGGPVSCPPGSSRRNTERGRLAPAKSTRARNPAETSIATREFMNRANMAGGSLV